MDDPLQGTSPYDDWAAIYDVWADAAPITRRNLPFYVDHLVGTPGPVVELGVGNGRIAIEAAKREKHVYGVDSSSVMLALCRQRARDAGVGERLRLVRADFRNFESPQPPELVAIPFHSIGHMLTAEDKHACLAHVYEQLVPGGRLIFDHFVFDRARAEAREGVPQLRGEYVDPNTGRDALLWATARYDFDAERMTVYAKTEELDAHGVVEKTKVRRLDFSWITPEESRALLEDVGFEIDSCLGCFDGTPFGPESREQIWVARKPS